MDGEFRPEYAGTVSSDGEELPALVDCTAVGDFKCGRRLRGPVGRSRGEVGDCKRLGVWGSSMLGLRKSEDYYVDVGRYYKERYRG